LTLDRVILHTVMHHSSTSVYISNFIEIKETFCEQTDGRTFETHFIRSTQSRSKKQQQCRFPRPNAIWQSGICGTYGFRFFI